MGRFTSALYPDAGRLVKWGDQSRSRAFVLSQKALHSRLCNTKPLFAQVAELVDALASGASDRKVVEVRVLFWAPFHPA